MKNKHYITGKEIDEKLLAACRKELIHVNKGSEWETNLKEAIKFYENQLNKGRGD
jgi:hypothetical protein